MQINFHANVDFNFHARKIGKIRYWQEQSGDRVTIDLSEFLAGDDSNTMTLFLDLPEARELAMRLDSFVFDIERETHE
jgi:hypothetical protein